LKWGSAIGLFGPAGLSGLIQEALAKGDLPTASGVLSAEGVVTVNGVAAKVGTPVRAGDRVSTGAKSSAVIVLGKDAYLLRENTNIVLEASRTDGTVLAQVSVLTGKLLSVLEKRGPQRPVQFRAAAATIGIRGTGFYLEIHESRTYFCLCYGEAVIEGPGMAPKVVNATHHESPLWLEQGGGNMRAEAGPFINHTDAELIMLEKLVGREPPFVAMGLTGRY
jgi:hypothetical protein